MNLYVCPSTSIAPISGKSFPVQCLMLPSYRLSYIDQALVYGSIVTNGYAGALSSFISGCTVPCPQPAIRAPARGRAAFSIGLVIIMFGFCCRVFLSQILHFAFGSVQDGPSLPVRGINPSAATKLKTLAFPGEVVYGIHKSGP